MKHGICFTLAILLLLSASGCSAHAPDNRSEVFFYYPREEYRYGAPDSVIVGETREMAGHIGDPHYLLGMYLLGPEAEELSPAFPKGTQLETVEVSGSKMTVALLPTKTVIPEIQFTLGAACLAKTCIEAFGADAVTILFGERSITLEADSLIIFDDIGAIENGGTE